MQNFSIDNYVNWPVTLIVIVIILAIVAFTMPGVQRRNEMRRREANALFERRYNAQLASKVIDHGE